VQLPRGQVPPPHGRPIPTRNGRWLQGSGPDSADREDHRRQPRPATGGAARGGIRHGEVSARAAGLRGINGNVGYTHEPRGLLVSALGLDILALALASGVECTTSTSYQASIWPELSNRKVHRWIQSTLPHCIAIVPDHVAVRVDFLLRTSLGVVVENNALT
jgi:hypothetical protein